MSSATFIMGFNAQAVELGLGKLKTSVSSFGKSFAGVLAGGFAVGGIVAGLQKAVSEGSKLQDLADKLNLPASEIQRLANAGSEFGVSTEAVGKGLQKMAMSQQKALAGNESSIEAFQSLGLTMAQVEKMTPTDLLMSFADALKNGSLQGNEMTTAMTLVGRGGLEMMGMLRQGSEEINRLAEGFSTWDDETINALDEADSAIAKLGNQALIVFGQIAVAIQPAVAVLAQLVKTLNDAGALMPVLGAIAGFMAGGPVGAVIGAGVGLALQPSKKAKDSSGKKNKKEKDFFVDDETGEVVYKGEKQGKQEAKSGAMPTGGKSKKKKGLGADIQLDATDDMAMQTDSPLAGAQGLASKMVKPTGGTLGMNTALSGGSSKDSGNKAIIDRIDKISKTLIDIKNQNGTFA
jgi:gas vesicle protein